MDKKELNEIKEILKLKKTINDDQDDGIIEHLVQSLLLAIIFGIFVMVLWNALLPELFTFPKIDYLQSIGLIILARLIFGGISFRHNHSQSKKSRVNKDSLMGLGRLDNISDWKYYDKYWKEEGEQGFENYKMRIKNDNSKKTDDKDNK